LLWEYWRSKRHPAGYWHWPGFAKQIKQHRSGGDSDRPRRQKRIAQSTDITATTLASQLKGEVLGVIVSNGRRRHNNSLQGKTLIVVYRALVPFSFELVIP
tara:strand:- start:244 stop:546 length:303 start_codon:yes stop_codon:yes gene_type:complete